MKQPLNPATNFAMLLMALAIAFTFLACEEKGKKANEPAKPDEPAKLLESIIYDNGGITKFEYDDKNRIVKILYYLDGKSEPGETLTLTYKDNDLVSVEKIPKKGKSNWTIKGKTISIGGPGWEKTMTVNEDGYIVKVMGDSNSPSETVFQYEGGNLKKRTFAATSYKSSSEFKHDNKKSPFHNDKTPKWFLQETFWDDNLGNVNGAGLNNNVTYLSDGYDNLKYEYEYDSDGFPTRQIRVANLECVVKYGRARFIYRGESSAQENAAIANALKAEEKENSDSCGEGEGCPNKTGPLQTAEATFLEEYEDHEGRSASIFRLANGDEIHLLGDVKDMKKGDKAFIKYKEIQQPFAEACWNYNSLESVEKQ